MLKYWDHQLDHSEVIAEKVQQWIKEIVDVETRRDSS